MLKILVKNQPVSISDIDYHYQEKPWPGDGHYRIELKLDNDLKNTLRRHYGKEMDFTILGLKTVPLIFKKDTYPIVRAIIDYFYPRHANFDIQWVLNNVESMTLDDNQLIIEGACSRFIENYSRMS